MIRKKGSGNAAKLCGIKFESIWTPGPVEIIQRSSTAGTQR
ncbi:hypothetical protein ACQF36_11720 [Streptomyces sp. Marseille-Q5077]